MAAVSTAIGAALLSALNPALGADSAATAAASGSRANAEATQSTAAAHQSSATDASQSTAPPSADAPARPKGICFAVSIQCIPIKVPASTPDAAVRTAPLDLRAPDIARVFPRTELQLKLPDPDEEREPEETVQVEGQRELSPVSVGLMAFPWAIMHPTQAWRIFMPLPSSQTK